MRLLKLSLFSLFIALVVVVLLTTAAALYVASSDQRTFEAVKRIISTVTPYELQLSSPSITWSPFSISADLVLLKYANPDSPPLTSIQRLHYSAPVLQLLSGELSTGELRAANVSYFLDASESEEAIDLESLLLPLSLLPASIEIDSVHFMSQREDLWIFPLLGVQAMRTSDGTLEATAGASFSGRPAQLNAEANWVALPGSGHRLDLTAHLVEPQRQSRLDLEGSAETYGPDLRYRFNLHGEYAEVSDFVAAFDKEAYRFSGALNIDGNLAGNLNAFDLDVRKLTLTTPDAYTFTASGHVTQEGNAQPRLDLRASGEASQLEALLPIPDTFRSVLERSELQLNVAGTLAQPNLRETGIRLYLAGDTQLELFSESTELALDALQNLASQQDIALRFRAESSQLLELLKALDVDTGRADQISTSAEGELRGTAEELTVQIDTARIDHGAYGVDLQTTLLWKDKVLSAPSLSLSLNEKQTGAKPDETLATELPDYAGPGQLVAEGTIADVQNLRGLALSTSLQRMDIARVVELLDAPPLPVDLAPITGSALLLRAAEPWQLRDIELDLIPVAGLTLAVNGDAMVGGDTPEADLRWSLQQFDGQVWQAHIPVPIHLSSLEGQLRLRPSYATVLSTLMLGDTDVQAVISADLEASSLTALSADLYSHHVYLKDLPLDMFADAQPAQGTNSTGTNPNASDGGYDNKPDSPDDWRDSLPGFPVHLALRADGVTGNLSEVKNLSLELEGSERRFLLKHFDATYAGGELMLRGLGDFAKTPYEFSLAGQGIRVPLAALTEDLGLQQEVRGALSFRGGLASTGDSLASALAGLNGRVALATNDVTISGAAYDLLMSNLLAWVVRGVAEKTTTFDCTMAQFDFEQGVARSDSLFIETRRMLATGKASLDLPGNSVDVRIEPRSKTRTFQFPSAVRIRGPLDDPGVSVSPLQTTADLSAQALLLLPSLTLRMFGIGPDDDEQRPCEATLQ